MPGWIDLHTLFKEELKQAREEGKSEESLSELQGLFESALSRGDDGCIEALFQKSLALPVVSDRRNDEPDSLEEILDQRPAIREPVPQLSLDQESLNDRFLGAWLGRCSGCALGKPLELIGLKGSGEDGVQPWQRLKIYLTSISDQEWPIRDFVPEHSPAEQRPDVGTTCCWSCTREHIAFMESDDDIRYTILGLILLKEKGLNFNSWDVACNWIRRLPYFSVCTAETQAYRNLVERYDFHLGSNYGKIVPDVDWKWVSTNQNPYREWIGAQIRVDSYGYICAGNPQLAAELAWRDARISHTKNGIYGAMFCAAMIAASFVTQDMKQIVMLGLDQIPRNCRLSLAIHQTVQIAESLNYDGDRYEEAFSLLHGAFEHYSPVHTIPNAALCALSMLLSGGDFHRAITLSVMGGWDTDCNGATVGSIVGAVVGASRLPAHWTSRLNNTLLSEIFGYHPISISECATQTAAAFVSCRH